MMKNTYIVQFAEHCVYDICDHCNWQNTGETNIDGGPNKMTLAKAKEAYVKEIPII